MTQRDDQERERPAATDERERGLPSGVVIGAATPPVYLVESSPES